MAGQEGIFAADAPRPGGAYSHAVRAGDFVFIAGQGSIDPDSGQIIGSTISEQTARTIANVETIAQAAGGSLRDLVKVSVFLSSIDLFSEFNETYEQLLDFEPKPARTTVAAELKGILVEIDGVLFLPSRT